jgi:hypothetical protein
MRNTKQKGFLKAIVLIIIALILLKYFLHFDVIEYFKSSQFQSNIITVKSWFVSFYNWLDVHIVRPLLEK